MRAADPRGSLVVAVGQWGPTLPRGLPRLSACHLVWVHPMNLLHSLLRWSSVDGRNDVGTESMQTSRKRRVGQVTEWRAEVFFSQVRAYKVPPLLVPSHLS